MDTQYTFKQKSFSRVLDDSIIHLQDPETTTQDEECHPISEDTDEPTTSGANTAHRHNH